MKTSILSLICVLAFSSQPQAQTRFLPPDTQLGAADVFVLCTVTDRGFSKDCHFSYPIADLTERLKAGTELGYLDAHPFPIPGASPGSEVETLVRLKVSIWRDRKGFDVTAPEGVFPSSSGPEIKNPAWVHSPHQPWAEPFMPERSARSRQKGEATVHCVATATGALVNCWVQQEAPTGWGFGDAALKILQHARLKPLTADGDPVAGRPYIETLTFSGQSDIPHVLLP